MKNEPTEIFRTKIGKQHTRTHMLPPVPKRSTHPGGGEKQFTYVRSLALRLLCVCASKVQGLVVTVACFLLIPNKRTNHTTHVCFDPAVSRLSFAASWRLAKTNEEEKIPLYNFNDKKVPLCTTAESLNAILAAASHYLRLYTKLPDECVLVCRAP